MKEVMFREYMFITGELLREKQIKQEKDKKNQSTILWYDKQGFLVAKREEKDGGSYANYVDENIYKKYFR